MTFLFWTAAAALFYSLVGYGLILLAVARLVPDRARRSDAPRPSKVSVLIAAFNEAPVIAEKLRNTLSLERSGMDIEVIVADDGSTDGTAKVARAAAAADPSVTVLDLGRVGKAGALAEGLKRCTGDVVVFSDANAMLAPGTLIAMLTHYRDPRIGGVCGQITVDTAKAGGIGTSESLFWRYDQTLKMAEACVGGTVSAQGSVYSVRRSLARAPRPGCTDDFDISVAVVHAGRRLTFEPAATTTEATTESMGNEMRRRLRSSERGWRSLMMNASLMNPFRHGVYAWQLVSHKLMRRLNPLFLVVLFVSNVTLIDDGWFYAMTGIGQITFYALALAGIWSPRLRRNKIVALASFFTFTHVALGWGILNAIRGKRSTVWTPAREAS
ncbi:glycosyltransferase [Jannaschia sp. LMIT008]|uniref:glycosyltransferase n=1 Tax=Jannaschia maritima TaxID=3032585 RepID=UPI0028122576|nr:glycosyltransferase [Jannaschia sp. LMIT008]